TLGTFAVSYGYNSEGSVYDHERLGLNGYVSDNGYVKPVKEGEVAVPSDMIAIGDAFLLPDNVRSRGATMLPPLYGLTDISAFARLGAYYDAIIKGLPVNDGAFGAMNQRHGGRWNIVFCDGHVEGLKPSDLFNYN